MEVKLRAIVTITEEYEADSKNYGNVDSVSDMIDMDAQNFERDPYHFIDCMLENENTKKTIKIKRVR